MPESTPTAVAAGSPVRWVPSLYFVQGLQFFVVNLILGLMLKNLGVGNDEIAAWTATLGLAWAFKPLWSPFLELVRSKKAIVVATQYAGAALLTLAGLALQLPYWFAAVIGSLFLMACTSATHDVACDGLYMAALAPRQQALYVGWQGAFFNASKFLTLGALMKLAGWLEDRAGVFNAWTMMFVLLAMLLAGLATWNLRALPNPVSAPAAERGGSAANAIWATQRDVLASFLRKPGIGLAIAFIVLFRFGEGQVQTIGPLFLIEARTGGGLGLSTGQVGDIYGLAGTGAFLLGSILGGWFAARWPLKRAMVVFILCMLVPNAVFAVLAQARPADLWWIACAVAVESFFYGFGFVGMILYLMQAVAPGPFQTAHYALGTGVMQLGFMLSKFISGLVQVRMGYEHFFLWTIACGVPALLLLAFLRFPQAATGTTPPP
jgi:PAT family beta-lactamase induction signal transducer AmpG